MSGLSIMRHECLNCTAVFHVFIILCQVKKETTKEKKPPTIQCSAQAFICNLEASPQWAFALIVLMWECWDGKGMAGSGCHTEQCVISKHRIGKLLVHGSAGVWWQQVAGKFSETECHVVAQSLPLHYSWKPVWEMYFGDWRCGLPTLRGMNIHHRGCTECTEYS